MKINKFVFKCSNCNELGSVANHKPNACYMCGGKIEILCVVQIVDILALVKDFNDKVKYESNLMRSNANIPHHIKNAMLHHEYRILQLANETFGK